MRPAIILNSTQTYEHVGCFLTMSGLKATLRDAGIEILFEIGVNEPGILTAPHLFRLNPDALIVINGEGTFHSDQPYARRILAAIKGVEHRTLLLNSQFTHMSVGSVEILRKLAVVQVRNKTDQAGLAAEGIHAFFCPDMLFAVGLDRMTFAKTSGAGSLYSDSHQVDVTKKLWSRYLADTRPKDWVNFHYYPLGNLPRIDRLLRARPFRTPLAAHALGARLGNRHGRHTLSETLKRFASADKIITGRYHAACLAVAFGKPLEFLSSNTPKIERLIADVIDVDVSDVRASLTLDDYSEARRTYLDTSAMHLQRLRDQLVKI